MAGYRIETERLELVAIDEALIRAEIEGVQALATKLGVLIPDDWPPEFNDADTRAYILQKVEGRPDQVGWWGWYCLRKSNIHTRPLLIGMLGFKGEPDAQGVAEVGYGLLPAFQRQGFGTEAVKALMVWASRKGARVMTAETYPELAGSVALLAKCGFTRVGPGSEEGVLLFWRDLPKTQE